jgi:hypothetical protein
MKKQYFLAGILILLIFGTLAYLPWVGKFGYYNDDWYLMYSARAYGPGVFWDIFSVDRPARALVMIPAYTLFRDNVLLYNLSAFTLRLVSAVSLFWLLCMLWPRQRTLALWAALLFLLYPGFLSQPNGIDYQSQMVSLAAALLSIALSIKASLLQKSVPKILTFLAAVLLGWLYLALVEYFIGFEFLRLTGFYVLESHREHTTKREMILAGTRAWLPNLLIPLGFLVWRLFFFESERSATDVGLQLGLFKLYPLQTLYHWTIQVMQDLSDVLVAAWASPLFQLKGLITTGSLLFVLVVLGLAIAVLYKYERTFDDDGTRKSNDAVEFLFLGLLMAVTGLIPIAMVNREVTFPTFSRYSLVSAVGVAIFLAGLLGLIRLRAVRYSAFALLLLIAMLTQYTNSVFFAERTAAARNFWWQVAWRVPQLEPRTTLVGTYPVETIEEDYFIWGPANLIYYPGQQAAKGIQPTLFAAVLNKDTVAKILAQERQEFDNRKNIITYKNYRNILLLSQPSARSCMHVIDGLHPLFSQQETESVRQIGQYSETEHILVDESSHTPPAAVFGPEPAHGWCYYYQKADLAAQRGDWDEIIKLAEEAANKNLKPSDLIEWMPFLQAYAVSGDENGLAGVLAQIQSNEYVTRQACQQLKSLQTNNDIQSLISSHCVTP